LCYSFSHFYYLLVAIVPASISVLSAALSARNQSRRRQWSCRQSVIFHIGPLPVSNTIILPGYGGDSGMIALRGHRQSQADTGQIAGEQWKLSSNGCTTSARMSPGKNTAANSSIVTTICPFCPVKCPDEPRSRFRFDYLPRRAAAARRQHGYQYRLALAFISFCFVTYLRLKDGKFAFAKQFSSMWGRFGRGMGHLLYR